MSFMAFTKVLATIKILTVQFYVDIFSGSFLQINCAQHFFFSFLKTNYLYLLLRNKITK